MRLGAVRDFPARKQATDDGCRNRLAAAAVLLQQERLGGLHVDDPDASTVRGDEIDALPPNGPAQVGGVPDEPFVPLKITSSPLPRLLHNRALWLIRLD